MSPATMPSFPAQSSSGALIHTILRTWLACLARRSTRAQLTLWHPAQATLSVPCRIHSRAHLVVANARQNAEIGDDRVKTVGHLRYGRSHEGSMSSDQSMTGQHPHGLLSMLMLGKS
nr:hypothetical protein CFP56_70206 [Quercus suber]